MADKNVCDNKEENAERNKEIEIERLRELTDLRSVLASPGGIRTIRRFISQGGLFKCNHIGNSRVYFNEGQRNFSLWILGEMLEALKEDPDKETKVASLLLNLNIQGEA